MATCWSASWYSDTGTATSNNYYTTASTSTSDGTTYTWGGYYNYTPTYVYREYTSQPTPPETNKEKQVRLGREKQRAEEAEKLRVEKELAIKTAEELLRQHIGEHAFGELYSIGYIEVDSQKHKGRKYRVPKNPQSMIDVLDDKGVVIDRLCVHPAIECPPGDHILTRLVLLELDEEHILTKANHHRP